MFIVTLAGSPSTRSRSGVVLERARRELHAHGHEVVSYGIYDFDAQDLLHARFDSPQVKGLAAHVEQADGIIVATPVYKASFSGALKVLLDLLPERALQHKVVLPLATGGSIAHMLAVDYALKPVLGALKAQDLLQGVFADDSQVSYDNGGTVSAVLEQRLLESLEQFEAALARRPRPVEPHLLNERLVTARWSI
ncbi:NADPH-dependent FMN reductase [Pseudomonas matsuisoli]|uniref:NAD(P)H-dependent FMN reductase n=1 Tax=Pseudomonas matsuisoli TaxID=1515666 RepID=A0A917PW18_9PSED|nr:NADPH-dependent FMN reductase [Pseudomonas matsuisoli]GGJ93855.1 NAD(P)H-dependent FMN reductase [Pseudomonas matsuisoli]